MGTDQRAGSDGHGSETFRRQRWTGWLAMVIGGPLGLLLVVGGIADGVPAVVIVGLGLLIGAAAGARIARGAVVLELDDAGFVDHRSGVRLAWAEIDALRPRVRWWRFHRLRALELHVRDPSVVADRITNRAGRAIVRHVPGGGSGGPTLGLNVIAADPNDVLDAFERRSGKPIPARFTFTGLTRS